MTDEQIAQFLEAHPDFSPAILNRVGSVEPGSLSPITYGFYGPNSIFFEFSDIVKFLEAKPSYRHTEAA